MEGIERAAMQENSAKNTKGLQRGLDIPIHCVGYLTTKDNDGYCTVYKMDCGDGLGLMTVYQVYPGIQLIYNDFEAAGCEWEGVQLRPEDCAGQNILEINHCREGREGSGLLSGSCLYLGEGDMSIHTVDNCASEMVFPLKHSLPGNFRCHQSGAGIGASTADFGREGN